MGLRLGFYEILAPLGTGGMGEVYRTRDTSLRRDVAIKSAPRLLIPSVLVASNWRPRLPPRSAERRATLRETD